MAERAVVVGSGPGASTAAMVLAGAGWDVVVMEKGRNLFAGALTEPAPETLFTNDELKMRRGFGGPDLEGEPCTFRASIDDTEPLSTGDVNTLPTTVAGGTVHWDAKVPRFWDIDFQKLAALGPIDGADIIDWPFDYDEIAPFYEVMEELIDVQGDADMLAEGPAGQHAPRRGPFPMPPGAQMYGSLLLADGARSRGLHP